MPLYTVTFMKTLVRTETIEAASQAEAESLAARAEDFYSTDDYTTDSDTSDVILSGTQSPDTYTMIMTLARFFSYVLSRDTERAAAYEKFFLGGSNYLRVRPIAHRGEIRADLVGFSLETYTPQRTIQQFIVPRSDYEPFLELIAEKINGQHAPEEIIGVAMS